MRGATHGSRSRGQRAPFQPIARESSLSSASSTGTDTHPLQANSINVAFTVSDIDRSLAWYTNVIGFTIDQRHEREGKLVAVSLRAGSVRILLGRDDGAKGWDRVKGTGFSVQFTTSQNIDVLAERIKAAGEALHTEPETAPWGSRLFRVKDPDGFLLVISSERPG
jgi:uncharacterized glyoxalase superfamily protein PhnB